MSGFVADLPLQWAARRSAERHAVVGLLGVRALRYVGQSVPPNPPAIEGLQVVVAGAAEVPTFHAETGLYGFVHLPPGPRRIELSDATGRFQPYAISVVVPDRGQIKQALETGGAPPLQLPPLLVDVALHLVPAAPTSPGMTIVWGVVREAASGAPVPLARIACTTVSGGNVVGYAGSDGSYLLAFPAERPASLTTPPQFVFQRTLALHSPRALVAAALATAGFAGGMPADLDSIDPTAAGSPFMPRNFQLRATDGSVTQGPNPILPVLAAQRSRWDIELLP
jgi:hypothetical protein